MKIFDSLTYTEDNCVLDDDELSEGQIYKEKHHPRWKNIIRWGAEKERVRKLILEFKPDVVSINAMHTPMYDSAYDMARLVKMVDMNIMVLMGGAHPSIAPEHVLKNSMTDYVLMGEGEHSIVDLLNCIEKHIEPYDVDGLVFREYKTDSKNHIYRDGDFDYIIHRNEKKIGLKI